MKPSWLALDTEDSDRATIVEDSSATVVHGVAFTNKRKRILWWVLKTLTILLCFFQIVTALLGLAMIAGVQEVGKVLTAIYMFFFAVVLGLFEAYQLKPSAFEKIDIIYKVTFIASVTIESSKHTYYLQRNFGFIFHPLGMYLRTTILNVVCSKYHLHSRVGKALFIIFIAFLSFGLEQPASLCFINGLSLCLFGAAQLALYLQYPEVFEQLSALDAQHATSPTQIEV
jgi:hypothetical protein